VLAVCIDSIMALFPEFSISGLRYFASLHAVITTVKALLQLAGDGYS
jgi:hypothetical protein